MGTRLLTGLWLLAACSSSSTPGSDAGTDARVDVSATLPGDAAHDAPGDASGDAGCDEVTAIHSVLPFAITVATGSRTELVLRLARDRRRCAGTYSLTLTPPVGTLPAQVTVPVDEGSVTVPFTASATAGEAMLRVEAPGTPAVTVPVRVRSDALPGCAAGARATLGVARAGASL
ncbi:MAG: hypothetical protein U0325_36935, partial [Polyangiales bacterium]